MAEEDASSGASGKLNRTTIAVSVSSFFVFAANKIKDADTREVLTILAPSFGVVLTSSVIWVGRRILHWRGNYNLKRWIKEVQEERRQTTNKAKQVELDATLQQYRMRLQQRRLDSLP